MNDDAFVPIGAPPGVVDQIVEQVRAKIVGGTFPPGSHVADASIATQMGVSRGPVREALQRLIQEGLLRNIRHRGVFVVELKPADITDISSARLAVDRLAAGQLAHSMDQDVLRNLDLIVDKMRDVAGSNDWSTMIDLDLRFHEVLVASLRSRRLSNFYQTLMVETRMSLTQLAHYYPDHYEIADEHRLLLDAIQRGNGDELDRIVANHLDHAGRKEQFERAELDGKIP